MKKFVKQLTIVFAVMLLFSVILTGCSTNTADKSDETTQNPEVTSQETTAEGTTEEPTIQATKAKKSAKAPAQSLKTIEKDIFNRVNAERKKAGKPALKWNDTLYKAAAVRAKEITTTFSHTRPNRTSCFTAITQAGYSYRSAAENIAIGQTSATAVMNAWMKSSGHKKNILSNNNTFACAVIQNPKGSKYGGYAFVQLFSTPR